MVLGIFLGFFPRSTHSVFSSFKNKHSLSVVLGVSNEFVFSFNLLVNR